MSSRNVRAAALVIVAGIAGDCGRPADPPSPAPAPAPVAAKPAAPVKPPPPDPMKDADAWRALPPAERAVRSADFVSKVDAGDDGAVERARAFLQARGEEAAIKTLARASLQKGSTRSWAHQAAGDVDIGPEVDSCLRSCESAEDAADAKYAAEDQRARTSGTWWADEEAQKKARALCDEVRAADARAQTPYGRAIGHWVKNQRATDVMKDSPALHGVRGPYLVFVSLKLPVAEQKEKETEEEAKKRERQRNVFSASLKDVTPAEIQRGTKILAKNLDLMERLYEGWMENIGPVFGLRRFGPDNIDDKTLLKVNVFSGAESFQRYNAKLSVNASGFARAYYMPMEPRFITTFDGEDGEDPAITAHVQCHEATHQLVHLYTWDLSRQALGRDVSWLDCNVRPLWSTEGFAEFFSSFAVKDGKYLWMQPFELRLKDIYIVSAIAKEKGWRPFEMKEFLSLRDSGQLQERAAERSGKQPKERPIAVSVMGNLFYARAWSLVYFLWNAQEGGAPKYRDRLVEYFKYEFVLHYEADKVEQGKVAAAPVGSNDFRRILIEKGAKLPVAERDQKLAAFEKEWQDFEAALVAAHKTAVWDKELAAARKHLQLTR